MQSTTSRLRQSWHRSAAFALRVLSMLWAGIPAGAQQDGSGQEGLSRAVTTTSKQEMIVGTRQVPPFAMGSGKKVGSSREGKLGLFEPAVANRGSNLKDPVSADRRPAHLALLVQASIDEAVGSTSAGELEIG